MLKLVSKAKEREKQNVMVLKARKAGRLKESNVKLEDLYKKMEVLYRVLVKMYENSEPNLTTEMALIVDLILSFDP